MSRKFNITNSSQLTLFATYKRIKLTPEDDIDITYHNIYHSHSQEAQKPDFVPTCDTTNLVSSDPIEETTLPSMAPTQLSISPEIPNVNLQPPLDIAQGPNDKPWEPRKNNSIQIGLSPLLVGILSERDAGFYYPCRIFNAVSGRTEDAFKSVGFRDWKHATGRDGTLHCHDKCLTHINAIASWHEYKLNERIGTSIESRINSSRSEQIRLNRHYIKSIAEVILLCSRLEIAFRGHDESENSLNKGNFFEVLQVIGNHDPIIQHRLEHGPQNPIYRSPEVQNLLLNIMGDMLRIKICDSVRKANFFSLLADESKDESKKEQLAIIVRYVDDKANIHGRSLTFVDATSLTAESLTTYLISTLNKHGLDRACIVSQGYDGAAVISGNCHGVQKELHPEKQVRQLPKLSDTRWTCRQASVNAICHTYDWLIATLEEVSGGINRDNAVKAMAFFYRSKDLIFCYYSSCLIEY
ncbi:Zinc finger MYM-type protein 1-like [Oopsacas minuta]|uniref:Zinc finger MYM-type protein 1-like n=1 Tax=Oopsacas minuta TaxID=111878 RepID=A0AAV7JRT0_9METZ|nr:Zinc finger MYM-type protein 1-like [Oopsacas minuta]